MSKKSLTPVEREERVTRRAKARAAAGAKVQLLREWRQARADAAEKREAPKADRAGVGRVPERLLGLEVTPEPYLVGKRGTPIVQPEDVHPAGNHAERRARGHRGRPRPPRRRELPGAVARRLERNRKAAQDLWA